LKLRRDTRKRRADDYEASKKHTVRPSRPHESRLTLETRHTRGRMTSLKSDRQTANRTDVHYIQIIMRYHSSSTSQCGAVLVCKIIRKNGRIRLQPLHRSVQNMVLRHPITVQSVTNTVGTIYLDLEPPLLFHFPLRGHIILY